MGGSKNEPAREGLPDGWSKEYRPRKTRPGTRARRDMFYIDPTNTYECRSLKDVYRYLESRDTSNSDVTPNKRKVQDLQISGNQSHQAEGPSDNIKMDTAHECSPKNRENSENMPSSEPEGVSQRRLTELELQKASVNNRSLMHESAGGEEANVEPKPKEKKQKIKPKQISPPLRASARLTALKLNQEASNVPRDSPVSTSTNTADQLHPTNQVKNHKSRTTSSLFPQKKDGAYSASASGHAEDKYPSAPEQTLGTSLASSMSNVGYQNVLPAEAQQAGLFETADAMPGSSLSSLLRGIWSDPCLEFAFKTLTGDIPVADCLLPPQNLNKGTGPDPCLEFAFRTLTGDIPVANYLLPPQNLNKGTGPDPCLEFAFKTLTGDIPVANCFLPPQNLNKGTGPNRSASSYDGARMMNHAQVDRVRMPVTGSSDKLYSSGWFPPQ